MRHYFGFSAQSGVLGNDLNFPTRSPIQSQHLEAFSACAKLRSCSVSWDVKSQLHGSNRVAFQINRNSEGMEGIYKTGFLPSPQKPGFLFYPVLTCGGREIRLSGNLQSGFSQEPKFRVGCCFMLKEKQSRTRGRRTQNR